MKRQLLSVLVNSFILLVPACAHAVQVRVAPDSVLYAGDAALRLGVFDVMVQTVAVINDSKAPVRFESLEFEAVNGPAVIQLDRLIHDNYVRVWAAFRSLFQDPDVQRAQDSIFLLSRVLPEGVTVSDSLLMPPGAAIVVRNRGLMFSSYLIPDTLRIRATVVDDAGTRSSATTTRLMTRYRQKNEFVFPLRGRWYIASSSSMRSHHRLRLAHEFALDLMRIGADGKSFSGEGSTASDYYAFGADVLAIADGTVISVQNEIPETEMPRPGESRREFAIRVLDAMWEADPSGHVAGGNHVVIEHANGEYSNYVHLKQHSVAVNLGDRVVQGQKVGELGISGDGFQPHLHFSVTDGPDMNYSQSLPVNFTNVTPVGFSSTIDERAERLFQAGEFVDAE